MPFQLVSKLYKSSPFLYIFQLFNISLAAVYKVLPSRLKLIAVIGVATMSVELMYP